MNHSFQVKLIGLVIVAVALLYYQSVMQARAALVEEREQTIATVEAYNAAVQEQQAQAQQASSEEAVAAPGWKDGVYEGKGDGFGGKIRLSVTVQGGKITAIDVLDASEEDEAYRVQAEAVLTEILSEQSTEVDTVSGATCTADGFLEAARDALGKAVE